MFFTPEIFAAFASPCNIWTATHPSCFLFFLRGFEFGNFVDPLTFSTSMVSHTVSKKLSTKMTLYSQYGYESPPPPPLTENAFDIEFNLLEINSLNLLQKPPAAQNRMWILWQIRVSDQPALIQFRLEGVGWRGRLGYVKGGLKWPGLGWGIRVG